MKFTPFFFVFYIITPWCGAVKVLYTIVTVRNRNVSVSLLISGGNSCKMREVMMRGGTGNDTR